MERIFVSYSRTNLDVVTQAIQDLKAVGIEAWHDQTLTGGQRWWNNILSRIRDCEIFIFALSPESLESEACRGELGYAAQLGKTILPLLVADGINLNLLSPPLNEIQVTDYRRCDKEAAFALVKAIHTAPAAGPLPDPPPTPPPVPVSYLTNLKEQIETSDTLSSQAQIALLFELEAGLKEGRSPTEIRDLLLSLKRREDLLAKVATKIDAALKSLEEKASVQPRVNAGSWTSGSSPHEGRSGGLRPEEEKSPQYRPDRQPEALTVPREPVPAKVPNSRTRRYACASGDTARLIADLRNWFDGQGFDCQQLSTETHGVLLQIKKRGGWREFVGMSTSLNIAFNQADDTLTVEIGAGKWIDKAVAGTVSMFVLWPLAITAGLGAWEQTKMPDKVFDYIGSRLSCR
jgi:TIR domain